MDAALRYVEDILDDGGEFDDASDATYLMGKLGLPHTDAVHGVVETFLTEAVNHANIARQLELDPRWAMDIYFDEPYSECAAEDLRTEYTERTRREIAGMFARLREVLA